jgi:hypothetical protein
MLKNRRDSQKFAFLLVCILVANSLVFGVFLSVILQQNSRNQIASKAITIMEMINSNREYTIAHVRPELIDRLEVEFLPEIIPNFAVRETFENFRQKSKYRDFFLKMPHSNRSILSTKLMILKQK